MSQRPQGEVSLVIISYINYLLCSLYTHILLWQKWAIFKVLTLSFMINKSETNFVVISQYGKILWFSALFLKQNLKLMGVITEKVKDGDFRYMFLQTNQDPQWIVMIDIKRNFTVPHSEFYCLLLHHSIKG